MALVGGPVLGPIVGGAIVDSYLGWRWTEYVLMLALDVIFLDETYPPALLVHKARRLRITTGNRALHAHHKEIDYRFKDLTDKYLFRPFRLLVTPICFFVALYASSPCFIPSGISRNSRLDLVGNLPFLGILAGMILGATGIINLLNQKFYIKQFQANANKAVPEARLPPMMLVSIFFCYWHVYTRLDKS
ncbi:Major facilitator superfamily domain general substrate transporter [Penicillium canescens]|nr:Major facilitator superfamily domain general substrate transporter [Penicillium canescens]